MDRTVELRAQREADVVGEEDRDLLQLVAQSAPPLARMALSLDFEQSSSWFWAAARRAASSGGLASTDPGASRWCRRGGRRSARSIRPACRACPTVDLVHLLEALLAQTRPWLTPSWSQRCAALRGPVARSLQCDLRHRKIYIDGLAERERQTQILLTQVAGVCQRPVQEIVGRQRLHVLPDDDGAGPPLCASVCRTTRPSC